jgi:alpha-amylase
MIHARQSRFNTSAFLDFFWSARRRLFACARLTLLASVSLALLASRPCRAQSGFDDDRVMLQGFYWESSRHGNSHFPEYGQLRWYELVRGLAATIRNARFDLVWLPPPSFSGSKDRNAEHPSAGYNPQRYFSLDNSYGSAAEQRALLVALLQAGIEPVADIVINHRNGTSGWADFQEPTWGTWAICKDDEAFSNPASGITGAPANQRGDCEEQTDYMGKTYAYGSFRDVAHTDQRVRDDIVRYLLELRSAGYRGWRYDMVHGYHGKWIACYNAATKPTFSVGEFDWGAHNQQRGWIWATSTQPAAEGADHLRKSSNVFDFTTFYGLKAINEGRYAQLYGFGNGIGMVADTTDGMPWHNRAVTFVENHDTGYRTEENGKPEAEHFFDSFTNGWQVEQAYAQILTHPGVPTVYWKHYFDWGGSLQSKIKALINARKVAGVHSGSTVFPQSNAAAAGVYAAMIEGSHGKLYVRIGGSDDDWQPSSSSYKDYREYAQGAGWKVWVGLPGNPNVRQASLHAPFPVPVFHQAVDVTVPNEPLCH